ncbi:MAG: bifunctional D-glycero-beta-D-manno-heptose-7-phosphate kinase/D-glycero-beta-D-manno-heptose 1-phosphate adenylyltransferase HldE [Gammaproteobacteria bacterium]|nr:bifunctional D-glycero-beta-D-manno-heptose-7-phosphate kinase/D-glycero-beta-D-manno-heptose 1-phosphate adenylyltransferase HldE [Gammaproteobacteria bacterium]
MNIELPEFETAKVLVLGDLMLDRYWHGDTSRISPEAPVPVVLVGGAEERPGGAGNVALNIASLGAEATLMGLTGNDEACQSLESIMQTANVRCHFQRLADKPTVTKLRVLSRHQQLIRLDFEDGFSRDDQAGLLDRFKAQLSNVNAVILSDYGKGTLTDIQQFIQPARAAGIPVLVDPKGNDFEIYRGVTVITPNLSEFEAVVGPARTDDELVSKGNALIKEKDLTALLVTRSEKGMTLLQAGKPPFHLPTRAREVFDVTGAGDTVISMLASALAAGKSLEDATTLSNLAAGVVVSKLGTATTTVGELKAAIRAEQYVERGSVSKEQLIQLVKEAQTHGEKVVMSNGCFDILHPGHVTYLQQAKKLGDRLIIAVNDDASVKRLKGPTRPINTVDQRMAVLAALECVDWVVPFGEDTPEQLICDLTPDILVKGGDYKPEDIAGGQCVIDNGGEVKVLDYIDGHSTTDIIQNILAK